MAKSKEVQNYLTRGKEISLKMSQQFRKILDEYDLSNATHHGIR
ncbi:hypothetical protein J2S74_003193 [Evansella vedderi]|uniref:Integrase n=1 Tax=Evansella vedderi TaxID=38282 RepID=A0ABT9ZX44_9BACI|nr:hypothetical protein [Evansella vedderi]